MSDERVDREALSLGRCPDCGTLREFRPGPSSGVYAGVECRVCGARFNVAYSEGRILFVQRTPRESEGGLRWH